MILSSDISGRFWNLAQKPREEIVRETLFIDDIIQKAHIERTIFSHLDGVKTVFDGGAGYGRFSIPLAKRGLHVTHFDISQRMIEAAKRLAAEEGVLENMTFVQGKLEDLAQFQNRQFDMVLSFDAPVSYTYPNHEQVIANLLRICAKRLIISVYCRSTYVSYLFNPIQKQQYILNPQSDDPLLQWYDQHESDKTGFVPNIAHARKAMESGLLEELDDVAAAYAEGGTPWPVSYGFLPNELHDILAKHGASDIHVAGPGALSRTIPAEILRNIMNDAARKKDFLEFCYEYDSQPWCVGMAKDNLVASAAIR